MLTLRRGKPFEHGMVIEKKCEKLYKKGISLGESSNFINILQFLRENYDMITEI